MTLTIFELAHVIGVGAGSVLMIFYLAYLAATYEYP